MIVSAWKAFWRQFGFYKEPVEMAAFHESMRNWNNAPFYTEEKRRNERLAEIARERAWVYANKDELLSKRKGFYVRLRALKNAEMAVEQGKPEPGK